MSAGKVQRLSQILGPIKQSKGNVLSKATINQIEKLVTSNSPIYHYQVLNLYNYFSFNRDQNAFRKIDSIFFPPRGHEVIEPSLRLAYRRLYCLIKYNSPYRLWLPKLKQLVHEAKLNSVDIKAMLNLGTLEQLSNEQEFSQIYDDFITLCMEEYPKMDTLTSISLRKMFYKNKIKSKYLPEFKDHVNMQINQQAEHLLASQLKFLLQSKKVKPRELFLYLFKLHTIDKRSAFFFYLYACPSERNDWATGKFTKEELLQIIPSGLFKGKILGVVEGIIAQCSFYRPYIDDFFQFTKINQGDRQQTRLKNPQVDYVPFLINAYYYFLLGIENQKADNLKKIREVISQNKYILAKPQYIYVYMAVRHWLIFYSQCSMQQRTKQQIELVKELAATIKNLSVKADGFEPNTSLASPTTCLKNIANLTFDAYLAPEFLTILEKIKNMYLVKQGSTSAIFSTESDQIKDVIIEYVSGKRPVENQFFFDQFKKIVVQENNKYDIWVAKKTQVNYKVNVHYLVKVKNKQTNKEIKYLLDFLNSSLLDKKKNKSLSRLWKHHYLVEWCNLKYQMATLSFIEDYFRSPTFLEHIKQLN